MRRDFSLPLKFGVNATTDLATAYILFDELLDEVAMTVGGVWARLPLAARATILMASGSLLFSIMGALVKLLGQHLDSFQIAFFRCLFGFLAILPFVLFEKGHPSLRTTHLWGHLLRAAVGVAAIVAGFYATTRLPLTDSTAISFTAPLFMILTAIFVLGEKVRWRRGLATLAGFAGVVIMVRPDRGAIEMAALVALLGALLAALSTTQIKRLSATEPASTIVVYFGLFSTILTALPAFLVWRRPSWGELVLLALTGGLGAVGQFFQVRAFALGELSAVAPIDYTRLIFAGVIGYIMFAEIPDQYALLGAAIIVGSTLYIAYREAQLSRLNRSALGAPGSTAPAAEITAPIAAIPRRG